MNSFAASFVERAREVSRDLRHRGLIQNALAKYEVARDKRKAAFSSWNSARQAAAEIKWEAINHLDDYLATFADQLAARGTKVHWASTAPQAREIILQIIRDRKAHSIIKSKAMTAEEIHLNEALEKAGFEVVESDLGEFIVQLRQEPPYHIVFPAMHLTRDEISSLFQRTLGSAATREPEELTMIARRALRQKYLTADVGITGANFAVAETGMISITENEGNARLTAALPRTMITLVGIEKVLPKLEDLALFLPMLATAGAGQTLTCYNTLYGGPRQKGEVDGPEEYHVVLLDNARTELLADPEQRDALHCIRCGACLNVCPIFRNVGGHTYGTTYSGPIGSVITPHLRGLQDWKHLSAASSLCGACTEACPVKIDLHHHLLHNRRNAAAAEPSTWERLAYRLFAFIVNHPGIYQLAKELGRWTEPLQRWIRGKRLDPARGLDFHAGFASDAHGKFQGMVAKTAMTEREKIFGRIREALVRKAPRPGAHDHGGAPAAVHDSGPGTARRWLPPAGQTFEEQVARFRDASTELKTNFILLPADSDLRATLLELRHADNWQRIATHRTEWTLAAADILQLPTLFTDDEYDVTEMERCDVGLTACDALIAQTGSVLVTNRSAGGRALSVLPPHHVVIARREQLVPDLTAGLALVQNIYRPNYPSMISIISGPSRTGDIERILVLGAHGPKKLTVICL